MNLWKIKTKEDFDNVSMSVMDMLVELRHAIFHGTVKFPDDAVPYVLASLEEAKTHVNHIRLEVKYRNEPVDTASQDQ